MIGTCRASAAFERLDRFQVHTRISPPSASTSAQVTLPASDIRLKAAANQLALDLYPCEINPRADILQQVRDFRKGAPFSIRRRTLGLFLAGFVSRIVSFAGVIASQAMWDTKSGYKTFPFNAASHC